MSLLKSLVMAAEGTDLSRLPQDVVTAIKSNVRKGADDLQQKWANALELVHKAYEIEGVQRPDPSMDAAWKQYEEILQYSVQQLAKSRGMDDDWRMSSAMFREAVNVRRFNVTIGKDQFVTEAHDISDVISTLTKSNDHKVAITENGDSRTLSFSKWGIQHNTKVTIDPID